VRIHTVAFPVYFDQLGAARFVNSTGADLAKLMATLSRRNDGSFVGLPSKRAVGAAAEASEAQGLPATETRRVLIVVDASANMLEPYWRQAVDGVEWLLADTGEGDSFQVMTLTAGAQTVVADTEGRWLGGEDDSLRERVVADMRDMTPAGAVVDLGAVPGIVRGFDPAPDEVYLLAASDPSLGRASLPAVGIASPGGAGIDVLLFGAGDNPEVVPHYWALALDGGGSLVAPAGDWP
jgi:hypothetical protein